MADEVAAAEAVDVPAIVDVSVDAVVLPAIEETLVEAFAAQRAALGVKAALRGQAAKGLEDNQLFLALTAPTQVQTLGQVKALTRQVNRLIRLVLNDTTGTE